VHLPAQFGLECVGRGFLDQFLAAALDGALALAQADDIALAIAQDLHLDVAGLLHERFQEDGIVAEGSFGFAPGGFDHGGQFGSRKRKADAAPATACSGLDQHRILDLFGHVDGQFQWQRFVRPGNDREAGIA